MLYHITNIVCISHKQGRNSPTKLCVGTPLLPEFVFCGKTDLWVRFGVSDGKTNEHCGLVTCTFRSRIMHCKTSWLFNCHLKKHIFKISV